jgi:hypothetical protein
MILRMTGTRMKIYLNVITVSTKMLADGNTDEKISQTKFVRTEKM